MKIAEQVAIITGAGSGLGRAMALGLARAGARITVADVRADCAAKVRQEIIAQGGSAEEFAGDLTQEYAARGLIDFTVQKFGRAGFLRT